MQTRNVDNLPGEARIAFLTPNPKMPNTASHARYEASLGVTTLAQLRARRGASTSQDIYFGVARNYITVQGLIPPPLVIDNRTRCPQCNNIYTRTGMREPERVWACGHRACHECQGRHHTICFNHFRLETCVVCDAPMDRLSPWL